MLQGAYLVNTARGAIVDRDSLVKVMNDGHLAGEELVVCWSGLHCFMHLVDILPATLTLLTSWHVVWICCRICWRWWDFLLQSFFALPRCVIILIYDRTDLEDAPCFKYWYRIWHVHLVAQLIYFCAASMQLAKRIPCLLQSGRHSQHPRTTPGAPCPTRLWPLIVSLWAHLADLIILELTLVDSDFTISGLANKCLHALSHDVQAMYLWQA